MRILLVLSLLLLTGACSDRETESEGHVWKEQTDMLDKARGVEDMVGEAAEQQRRRIDEQAQ